MVNVIPSLLPLNHIAKSGIFSHTLGLSIETASINEKINKLASFLYDKGLELEKLTPVLSLPSPFVGIPIEIL